MFIVGYFKMKDDYGILLILGSSVHSLYLFLSIRYGKRTTQGILNDLRNALARYYLNNFVDGTKQVSS